MGLNTIGVVLFAATVAFNGYIYTSSVEAPQKKTIAKRLTSEPVNTSFDTLDAYNATIYQQLLDMVNLVNPKKAPSLTAKVAEKRLGELMAEHSKLTENLAQPSFASTVLDALNAQRKKENLDAQQDKEYKTKTLINNLIETITLQHQKNSEQHEKTLHNMAKKQDQTAFFRILFADYEATIDSQQNIANELIKGVRGSDSALEDAYELMKKQLNYMQRNQHSQNQPANVLKSAKKTKPRVPAS